MAKRKGVEGDVIGGPDDSGVDLGGSGGLSGLAVGNVEDSAVVPAAGHGIVDTEKVFGKRIAWRSADGTISLLRSKIDPADAATVIGAVLRLIARGNKSVGAAVASMVMTSASAVAETCMEE